MSCQHRPLAKKGKISTIYCPEGNWVHFRIENMTLSFTKDEFLTMSEVIQESTERLKSLPSKENSLRLL